MGINTAYFTSATEAVNNCKDCATLDRIDTQVTGSVNDAIDGLNLQISRLSGLLSAPGDLSAVITWITNYINVISLPVTEATAEVASLTSQLSSFASAVSAKRSELGCP